MKRRILAGLEKTLVVVGILAAMFLTIHLFLVRETRQTRDEVTEAQEAPQSAPGVYAPQGKPATTADLIADSKKPEVVTINDENSVVMDQVFDDNSVQKVMIQLQKVSDSLSSNKPIYLIMNTPGGSVPAGMKLITFAKALPQKVKTITIFAASMGFMTVQSLDERLILADGTLMAHPAAFGVDGQTPYQVKNRLAWIMSQLKSMETVAAGRMGLSLIEYQELVHDEYWVFDQNAVKEKAADRLVLARCGVYKEPTKTVGIATPFGMFEVEFPSCPLIPGFLSVKPPSNASQQAVEYVNLMLTNKYEYTKEYIIKNKR